MAADREPDEIYRVTTLELFFDLVFVFAITQLTSVLVHDLSLVGLAQIVLQFGVLWWMYGGYAWLTNTLPLDTNVRKLLMLSAMAGFLMIALSAPTAFAGGGVVWGLGYLLVVAVHGALYRLANRNILRVVPGNVAAGVLIVIAGLLDGPLVYVLWVLALLIPIVTPYLMLPVTSFRIGAEHIVERHGLLVIITLGESVIAIGIGAQDQELNAGLVVSAVLALALVGQLWWSYFDRDDERAEHALKSADEQNRTRMTMFGYFHAHIPIIVGVIVLAAGLKKVLGHAWGSLSLKEALALGGGLALYLAGDVIYRRVMGIGPSLIRLTAALAALATVPLGPLLATGQLAALIVVFGGALLLEARASRTADIGTGRRSAPSGT